MGVNIITAVGNYVVGKGYPIGKNGRMPWSNKADLKWFKETTMGHPIIMGFKTWESIGKKPLTGRLNIVVSKNSSFLPPNGVYHFDTLETAIAFAKSQNKEDVFVIGGASIYKCALENNLVDKIYIDYIAEDCLDADTFFPDFKNNGMWAEESETIEVEKSKAYAKIYVRLHGKNQSVDEQYLNLINEIIEKGEEKDTRAGKTRSLFSRQIRFNLKEGLPMLTTKKMFSKGVIYELLWFLKGDTNIKYLVDNDVHIWDDDAYRYYLELCKTKDIIGVDGTIYTIDNPVSKEGFLKEINENRGFRYVTRGYRFSQKDAPSVPYYRYGDLNNVYGYQWTKWGGHNQIQEVIDTLKKNPDDRRMIVSAWNVEDIPNMALPPCHFCCQFYTKKLTREERYNLVYERIPFLDTVTLDSFTDKKFDEMGIPSRKLSCVWHQRSVDSLLGLPFNILSYSILMHMIAQCANMDVDELIFDGGDVHVYENQIEKYKKSQMQNNPHIYALPTLKLNPDVKNITDFTYEDIKIEGYNSYPTIKYPLSVGL